LSYNGLVHPHILFLHSAEPDRRHRGHGHILAIGAVAVW
jgi:hypothetical protein